MNHEHGGDIYGRDILYDFSANLNPFGMPESVIKAACAAVPESDKYPDPYCRELTGRLSEHENVSAGNIVCGNGADDLIYRIIHALEPKRAVVAVPTFSEYAKALSEVGCKITEHRLEESADFALDESILQRLTDDTDILILCSPNNPTGRLIDGHLTRILCGVCRDKGIVFVCDECFLELTEFGSQGSAGKFMNGNVVILKAFTKTYAMAGLRLGYALFGSAELAERVRRSGQFWSVSAPAQAAGIAALGEREYVGRARKLIPAERAYLSEMLEKYGFKVYPSDADFILFRCGLPLDELLLNEGILIRSCGNYSGLGDGYFRIAVRLREENEKLVGAIEKVMKWQKA